MTTKNAAEALEEVLAKEGAHFEYAAIKFILDHAATLRAALAQPAPAQEQADATKR